MARFWILSDLHQEYAENAFDLVRPDAPYDAVIAAGDICGPAPDAVAWLRRQLPHDRIVYVCGNHDFWQDPALAGSRLSLWGLLDQAREAAARLRVDLLSDDAVEVAGARILGSTLWTDYRVEGLCSQRTAMRTVQRGMNDYRMIRRASSSRPTRPVDPMDLLGLHVGSRRSLEADLDVGFDGPTVVVTHHAPHPRSLAVQHDALNPAYASDLTWLIERYSPALWVHGHIHAPRDYTVDGTRIVCNPRGYASERQQARWDGSVIVEV